MDDVISSKEQSLVPETSSSMTFMPTVLHCHAEWLPMSVVTAGVWLGTGTIWIKNSQGSVSK